MKKTLLSLFVFALFAFVVGCVSAESIKSDFEEGGYTYSADASTWISALLAEFQQDEIAVTASVFSKGLQTAIVLEFDSTKDMKKELDESATLQGLITDLEEADLVRGNFLLIPIALSDSAIQEIIDTFNGNPPSSVKG